MKEYSFSYIYINIYILARYALLPYYLLNKLEGEKTEHSIANCVDNSISLKFVLIC